MGAALVSAWASVSTRITKTSRLKGGGGVLEAGLWPVACIGRGRSEYHGLLRVKYFMCNTARGRLSLGSDGSLLQAPVRFGISYTCPGKSSD